jgi:hypothetical protein
VIEEQSKKEKGKRKRVGRGNGRGQGLCGERGRKKENGTPPTAPRLLKSASSHNGVAFSRMSHGPPTYPLDRINVPKIALFLPLVSLPLTPTHYPHLRSVPSFIISTMFQSLSSFFVDLFLLPSVPLPPDSITFHPKL